MFDDDDFDIDEEFLQDVLPSLDSASSAQPGGEAIKRHSGDKIDDSVASKKSRGFEAPFDNDFTEPASRNCDISKTTSEIISKLDCFSESNRIAFGVPSTLAGKSTLNSFTESPSRNTENKPNSSTVKSKRKFPGPAGLLPHLDRSALMEDIRGESQRKEPSSDAQSPRLTASQSDPVASAAWREAARSLQMNPGDEQCPLGRFTLAWVRQRAVTKQLPQHKVPFLLVGLRAIDPSTRDPSVSLQDLSGEMNGILHKDFWLEYNSQVQPGAVLALRQVGVLSTGPFARHQCLNITANNVVAIFAPGNSQENTTAHSVNPMGRDALIQEVSNSTFNSSSRCMPSSSSPARNMQPGRNSENSFSRIGPPLSVSTQKNTWYGKNNDILAKSGKPQANSCTYESVTKFFAPKSGSAFQTSDKLFKSAVQANVVPSANNANKFTIKPQIVNVSQETNTLNTSGQQGKFTPKSQAVLSQVVNKFTPKSQTSNTKQGGNNMFMPKSQSGLTNRIQNSIAPKAGVNNLASSKFVPQNVAINLNTITPASDATSSEPDVNSLLEGLDTDLLFGDF